MRTSRAAAVVAAASLLLQGCALANGRYQTVSVATNVPARVTVDGRDVGETSEGGAPVFAQLRRSRSHFVTAHAPGRRSQTASLQSELSTLGVLDVVGGVLILVPFVTLLTGHAFELSPDFVQLHLPPEDDE